MSKQKIKIMNKTHDVSDEEIRSYMNFEEVLVRRTRIAGSWRSKLFRWGIPLVIVVGALVTWQFTGKSPLSTISSRGDASPSEIPGEKEVAINVADSINHVVYKNQVDVSDQVSVHEKKIAQNVPLKYTPTQGDLYQPADSAVVSQTTHGGFSPAAPVEGYDHLYKYFNENLRYPSEALKDSVQGVLTISFTIDELGKPDHLHVTNSPGELFEKEAIRLIEMMPAWSPAVLNGKPVKSKMSLPLTFRITRIKGPPQP
jgi:TonB family protein